MYECDGRNLSAGRIAAHILLSVVAVVAIGAGMGYAVKALWNWLMPEIFGLKLITFWQAIGLMLLCHILFKFGAGHKRHSWHPFARPGQRDMEQKLRGAVRKRRLSRAD